MRRPTSFSPRQRQNAVWGSAFSCSRAAARSSPLTPTIYNSINYGNIAERTPASQRCWGARRRGRRLKTSNGGNRDAFGAGRGHPAKWRSSCISDIGDHVAGSRAFGPHPRPVDATRSHHRRQGQIEGTLPFNMNDSRRYVEPINGDVPRVRAGERAALDRRARPIFRCFRRRAL